MKCENCNWEISECGSLRTGKTTDGFIVFICQKCAEGIKLKASPIFPKGKMDHKCEALIGRGEQGDGFGGQGSGMGISGLGVEKIVNEFYDTKSAVSKGDEANPKRRTLKPCQSVEGAENEGRCRAIEPFDLTPNQPRNPESFQKPPLCECGHAREEHFREDGDCMHKYDDDNRCDCEGYMPPKKKAHPESLKNYPEGYCVTTITGMKKEQEHQDRGEKLFHELTYDKFKEKKKVRA